MAMNSYFDETIAKIAGDVILSNNPGQILKYWRKKLHINQLKLAKEMQISSSTLSDYENGRRVSPGIIFLKKYISSLVTLSKPDDSSFMNKADEHGNKPIIAIGEFSQPIKAKSILSALNAKPETGKHLLNSSIYGYTVVDSIGAIYSLSGFDFYRIFGATSERVLIFTKVGLGRSPFVAVRVSQLKPRMIILHGTEKVDSLAVELANKDNILFGLSKSKKESDLPRILKSFE